MKTIDLSQEDMSRRTARFADLKPYKQTQNDAQGIPPAAMEKVSADRVYPVMSPEGWSGRNSMAAVKVPAPRVRAESIKPGPLSLIRPQKRNTGGLRSIRSSAACSAARSSSDGAANTLPEDGFTTEVRAPVSSGMGRSWTKHYSTGRALESKTRPGAGVRRPPRYELFSK